ncbi:DsbA family oxidoreductase [Roseivirga sp.]|uniref:DsbA family oxidoreductase n=1 Tax=Roseivirga sp. TaxID=1964215 RepID=UPI003B8B8388
MSLATITVDIVSDVACPWCYVGKRRFEAALEQWKGAPIKVEWHPYQLDPNMVEEGLDRDTYLVNKFGSIEKTQDMTKHLTNVGKEVGINFDFGPNWLAVNTLHLHQLLHVAGQEGYKDQLKEKFLSAYFEETKHLNKREVLNEIMAEFGWSSDRVTAVIEDDSIAYAVKSEIAHYQQLGVSGVPFFIINNKYGISGAQPSEVFLEALNSVSPIEVVAEGDSCDPATGEC